jgi:transposase-like protein
MSARTIFCRFCGAAGAKKYGKDRQRRQRYRCPHCSKIFNNRTNTIRSGSQLSDNEWHLASRLFATRGGVSGTDVARILGYHRRTGQQVNRKLRQAIGGLMPQQLPGASEWDEAKMSKEWVLGGVSRNTGKCIMGCILNRRAETLVPLVMRYSDADGVVFTDEWGGYIDIPNRLSVCHAKEYVRSDARFVHTNTQEGVWGHLKPLGRHVYRGFPRASLPKYLAEFMFRYNVSKYKTSVSVLSSLLTRKTNSLLS